MSSDRETLLSEFLHRNNWGDAKRWTLAGDASFRRYDRLENATSTAVLMDAPPPQEDVRPFVHIARHLYDHGFSTPQIMAEDAKNGFLLLEDLGDNTYTKLLAQGHSERELYVLATDTLITLHKLPENDAVPKETAQYQTRRLLEEVGRLHEWYFPLVGATPLADSEIEKFNSVWRSLLPLAWKAPSSLILFDYHVDNLLLLPDRPGIKACGLLDFQDAVAGPVTYDLMSLLEDARRDVNADLIHDMKQRYLAAFSTLNSDDFDLSWAIMAAQRHVRVIGTFARLKMRDGKPQYLKHMPRLWRYMDQCLAHPALSELNNWFNQNIPPSLRAVKS